MQNLRATHVFCGIAVRDFTAARDWYEQLFGRPPDMLPHDAEAVWNLAEGGLVYVVRDATRAGGGLVTLMVPDLEQALAGIAERGLEAGPVEVMGSGARKATMTDPDGNRVSFAQV
jgi:predicted enzyme related to lactoylglutathione lyase